MKFLIIGFGKMGMLHAAILSTLEGASNVIVAEQSRLVRDGVKAISPRTKVVADYRAALSDPEIVAAVIATPTASHGPLYCELASRMRGVFVEKPFAVSAAEAATAIAACPADRRVATMVGHCLRFSPPFEEAKRLLDAGVLGETRSFDASIFSSDVLAPSRSWRFRSAATGGGVLLDLGSHLIDMTRWFFGPPLSLVGRTESLVSGAAEDRFESRWTYLGFTGTVRGSWSEPDYRKATLQITVRGTNGTLEVSDDAVEFDLAAAAAGFTAGRHRRTIIDLEQAVAFDLAGPMYTRQLTGWIGSLRGAAANVNSLDESLANLRLADAIRASSGQPIALAGSHDRD